MTSKKSVRLDQILVDRGLAETKSRAQAIIMAGSVLVNDQVRDKPGEKYVPDIEINIKEGLKYVSRGGLKLEGALDSFEIRPSGRICMDVGASTGGFTDLLLQRGAKKVYAIDVGKGQLDWKLRNDERVVVMEGLNARYLDPSTIGDQIDLVVIDVSFISLELILPAVLPVMSAGGELIGLVKPQFEAGRDKVGKGGVVRDPDVIEQCIEKISVFAENLGLIEEGRVASPVKGPKGNQEYLLYLTLEK